MTKKEAAYLMQVMIDEAVSIGREGGTSVRVFGKNTIAVHKTRHAGCRAAWRINRCKYGAADILDCLMHYEAQNSASEAHPTDRKGESNG